MFNDCLSVNIPNISEAMALGHLNSNFIWILLRMGECPGHMTKVIQGGRHAYMAKPFKNLLRNQKNDDLGTWYVALRMWA